MRHPLAAPAVWLPLAVFLLLGAWAVGGAQVVNVERLRLTEDQSGWSGAITGDFNVQENQTTVLTFNAKGNLQYRRDSNIYLAVVEAGVVSAEGQDLANFAFSHLRYSHHLNARLYLEAFTQLQQNRVNGIQSRFLYGAGPRLLLFDAPGGSGYTGFTVMQEREVEVIDSVPVRNHTRLSAYVAGSYTPESADWVTIAMTTYYQPRFGRLADYRISSDWDLQVGLREGLSFVSSFNLVYDARPAVGIAETIYLFKNGVRWVF